MTLTVGRISYVNITPFFYHLAAAGFSGRVVDGVPAELNARLAAGAIDLSPSSSFEYARNWREYLLLPGLSISSVGPVRSVLLFSHLPLEALAREEIAFTRESATSVVLCQVLLKEFCGAGDLTCRVPEVAVEEVVAGGGSALLIGDRALRLAQNPPAGIRIYDLGELWHRFTGLPFVFALWIVRRRVYLAQPCEVHAVRRQLGQALALAYADLDGMARAAAGGPLPAEELVSYWRDAVSYELTAAHLAGLQLFFELCRKHGLLDELPEFAFAE